MCFFICKTQPAPPEEDNPANNNNSGEEEAEATGRVVSSHVYIKPAHSSEKLNKEVVLRRIKQRKRANKVRSALQGFAGAGNDSGKKVHLRWIDDAFAAP